MTAAPIIRPAREGEGPALAALVDAAYGHYVARIGRKPGPMLDDYDARVAAGQAHVATDAAGAILGVLVLEDCADGALLLDNIAVAPAAKGTGVGRALMVFADAEAARRGAPLIRLYTHEMMVENVALYARVGFVETGRIEEKGFRRVYMEKRIG